MEYILGNLTILNRLDLNSELIDSEVIYYGASDSIPTEIASPFSTKMLSGPEVICPITSRVPGQALGRYCWVAFPVSYGQVTHIYSVYEKGLVTIDLLDSWEYITVIRNKKPYYLYYQTKRTKDNNLNYQFIWSK